MSVPQTLEIPAGVEVTRVVTPRCDHAVHVARAEGSRRGSVLLVHGWTGSKEDFTPILPLLAARGFDVVAYDQRGQYETPGSLDDDYSLEAFAGDALALAEAAFEDERFHLLGHSFGGLVAQRVALAAPDRLASLSLLCSGPGALGDSPTRPLKHVVAAIGQVPLLQIHQLREKGVKRPAQITAFLAKRFTSGVPAALKAITQHLIDAPDLIDDVAETQLPCWVARGANDDAWPFETQDDMARRLGTEVVVLPSSAHSPAVEAPEELVDAWLPFLTKH
ncbi:alpha/beta hydrolase [Aeromicrobium phragmitis]|uniref:Alpha/beta hydrolase n=1 Tax=Aeromicrobium phragmitis TaxID=2478914 RepID=A0A3L8PHQ4_9ACTN|nr:alpha/beta hydrolase [Aeromicrobium phragmitis]RLV54664.1 alpha/beta hydrolase [Aeromicrobium phragmitis]